MNKILHKKNMSGFTLIELMITVTIIGIVAAIAYPSYNQHVLRTHRAEGKAMLAKAIVDQERHFSSNNTYAADLTIMGYTNAGTAGDPAPSEHGYYNLTVTNPAGCAIATCYSMTITAAGAQAADGHCATMTQTSTGRKSATNADCWQR